MKIERVLLIGLGSIGKRHLGNLQKLLPEATITILRSSEGGSNVVGCDVVTSLETAIDFQPDMAVICSPSSFHMDVAWKLAKEGVHLFIEKPLSDNMAAAARFIEKVDTDKLKVMVGYNLRFSHSLLMLKKHLDEETLGRPLVVSAEVGQYLPDWRVGRDYRSGVSAQASLGGGALLELSHELDYLLWLFGEAVSTSAKLLKVSDLEIDVEDLVLAYIDFKKDGFLVPATVQLDFLQHQPFRRCKVVCEKGELIWDAIAGKVDVCMKNETKVVFQDDKDISETYEREMLSFINSIEDMTPLLICAKDGIKVLELIEAMRKSSNIRRAVDLI